MGDAVLHVSDLMTLFSILGGIGTFLLAVSKWMAKNRADLEERFDKLDAKLREDFTKALELHKEQQRVLEDRIINSNKELHRRVDGIVGGSR